MTKVSKRALARVSKMLSFAGLTLLTLLALTGCNEVRKCKRGAAGCIGGVPDKGECEAGLEVKNGKCAEPTSSSGSGGGRCNCAVDEICSPDNTCLAYCEPVDNLPVANPTPPSCTPVKTASDDMPVALTFRELCVNTCMQNCVRAQAFCPGYTCNPSDCDNAQELLRCTTQCPGMDTACMEQKCTERSTIACTDFNCPGTATRNCQDINCSDSCTGNVKDGFCDDGDPTSATYSFCAYGKDCTDCGPRRGNTRPARLDLGEPCPEGQDVSCDGYNDDFLKTQAWCLRYLEDADAPFRCVPDCTTSDGAGECPKGYECQAVKNGSGQPYRDATPNRTAGYACVPQICE